MHISDGILSLVWVIIWYVIAVIFLWIGVKQIKMGAKKNPSYVPTLALMGALVFVVSVWHIPVPVTGSCGHPIGTPMAAIIVGPSATVVLSAIALFFQIFLAHGGLTTIGANTVSMGIVGTFTGFGVYVVMHKAKSPLWLAAGMAAFVGDILCYATTALQLALSLFPETVAYHWGILMIGFMPTQLPLAIAEFIFTAMVIRYVAEQRPDIMAKMKWQAPPSGIEGE